MVDVRAAYDREIGLSNEKEIARHVLDVLNEVPDGDQLSKLLTGYQAQELNLRAAKLMQQILNGEVILGNADTIPTRDD